ncbi:MAG: hypothetical protein ACKO24_13030 [Leptolyngbyaceae cyanobacterium]
MQIQEPQQQPLTGVESDEPSVKDSRAKAPILKKIRGGVLLTIGFLLSPLSWWNDLIFNLPVAYGFGYLCSLLSPHWLVPGTIAGYWFSNVLGILLMQSGLLDMVPERSGERSLKQELLTGIVTSTAYTLLIVGLLQFHLLETPAIFASEQLANLSSLLPW